MNSRRPELDGGQGGCGNGKGNAGALQYRGIN